MSRYDEAIEWMNTYNPFFLTFVTNLGAPVYDKRVPSLAVASPKDDPSTFNLYINPDEAETFTDEEMAGALIHEALHIILDHLTESADPQYDDAQSLVIAHEIICNDRLYNAGFILNEKYGLRGETYIHEDASPYTTHEAYDKVVENMPAQDEQESPEKSSEESESGGASSGASQGGGSTPEKRSGKGSKGEPDSGSEKGSEGGSDDGTDGDSDDAQGNGEQSKGEPCGFGHDADFALSSEAAEAIVNAIANDARNSDFVNTVDSEILDILNIADDFVDKGNMAGNSFTVSEESFAKELGVSLAWAKILSEVNPDVLRKPGKTSAKYRSSWRAPRRNLAHAYPKVMVPRSERIGDPDPKSKEGNKKQLIVLALDFSGSIPRHLTKVMAELANSVPLDKIEVECCTFSTYSVPFDPTAKKNRVACGGTEFSAVEDFARSAAKKRGLAYPKAIICITDGQAHFGGSRPTRTQLKENWTWLNTLNRVSFYDNSIPRETIKPLTEYVK